MHNFFGVIQYQSHQNPLKQCTESAQKSAQFFQFWYSLYQHIFILIDAKVDENQRLKRFASMIN